MRNPKKIANPNLKMEFTKGKKRQHQNQFTYNLLRRTKMKKFLGFLLLVSMFFLCFIPMNASATTLLVAQNNPYLGYGYGLYSWNNMTGALNNSFGSSNITTDSNPLDDLNYLMGFDRLWVTAGSPGQTLSATEIDNIKAFIATGKRVVLIGENDAWTAWNNSILETVGGSYNGSDTSDTLIPVVSNELTAGVSSLSTVADGTATGGTSLFSRNVATLWGNSSNVLSLLSVNVIDDGSGSSVYNKQFESNMASWLKGEDNHVPEPTTMLLLGSGLAGLASFRKRFLKK